MSVNGVIPQFYVPSEPLPVPALNNIAPLPNSPEEESFLILGYPSDENNLPDDSELSQDISILSESKRVIEEALLEETQPKYPQPSLKEQPLEEATSEDFGDATSAINVPLSVNQNGNSINSSAMPQPQLSYEDLNRSGIVTFTRSDFSSEEIHTKVSELIEQNKKMRETVIQNSKTLEAQKDHIHIWHSESKRVHEAHKEKLMEAKNCISALNKEVASLKEENEKLKESLVIQNSEYLKARRLLQENTENNVREFDLDIANKKIKELEEALEKRKDSGVRAFEDVCGRNEERINEELTIESANRSRMDEKLLHYEKELENNYKKISELEKQNMTNGRSQSDELKVIKEKLLLSEMANERMGEEVASLRSQLAKSVQSADNVSKLQTELNNVRKEHDRMAALLDARNLELVDMKALLIDNEQQLRQATANAQSDMRGLMDREEQAKVETWKAKQKITELEQQLQLVQKNLEAKAQQVLTQQHSDPGDVAYIRQQLAQSQIALNEAVQKRAVTEARLASAVMKIEQLTKEKESMTSADELFALKEQLNVYRSDFEDERKIKEEEKAKSSKMSEDMQQLHRRNQQLQEEVEMLRGRRPHVETGAIPRHRNNGDSSSSTSKTSGPTYDCPKCHFRFDNLKSAEMHINRCLDVEDSLP